MSVRACVRARAQFQSEVRRRIPALSDVTRYDASPKHPLRDFVGPWKRNLQHLEPPWVQTARLLHAPAAGSDRPPGCWSERPPERSRSLPMKTNRGSKGGERGSRAGPRPGRPRRVGSSQPTAGGKHRGKRGEDGRLPGREEALLRISCPRAGPAIRMRLPVKRASVNQDSVRPGGREGGVDP